MKTRPKTATVSPRYTRRITFPRKPRTSYQLTIQSLDTDWHDKDIVMLHACFQLLDNFLTREKKGLDMVDWNHSEETRERKKELAALHTWWEKRRQSVWPEDDCEEEDDTMLARLLKLRRTLWT